MSNRITNISAIVSGRDTTFSGTMRNVREELTRTANAAVQTANSLRAADVFGGIMPVFDVGSAAAASVQLAMRGARAAVDEFNQSLKRIEDRKDAADVLGFTYNEMQAIEVAATLANMPVDRLSGTFGRLLKTVALAGEGSSEAQKDLARLGLTLRNIQGLTSFQVLELVADRLAAIESPAERAAASMELFGREAGLKMTQVLAGGSESLRDYMKRAEELGLTLDPFLVDQAKRSQDAFDMASLQLNGRIDSMSARLSGLKIAGAGIASVMVEAAASVFDFGLKFDATRRLLGISDSDQAVLDHLSIGSLEYGRILSGDLAPLMEAVNAKRDPGPGPLVGPPDPRIEYEQQALDVDKKIEEERMQLQWERMQERTKEEEAYWRDVREMEADSMREYEKDLQRIRDADKAAIQERNKIAYDTARDAAQAWDQSGGGMAATPLAVMGTAEQQLASYQASRARDNAAQRADFIRNAIRDALQGITVNTNVVQGGVNAAAV